MTKDMDFAPAHKSNQFISFWGLLFSARISIFPRIFYTVFEFFLCESTSLLKTNANSFFRKCVQKLRQNT